ncbi:MAG: tol-pal system protein YbgF [Alphaproteobacteria bacterium]
MRKILFISVFILLVQKAYCFDGYNDQESDMSADRLDRIEKDLNILQKRFYQNSNKSSSNKKNNSAGSDVSDLGPNIEIRLSNIEEQIRSLIGNLEQVEHSVEENKNKLEKLSEDIEFRLRELEQKNSSLDVKKEEKSENKKDKTLEVELKEKKDITESKSTGEGSLGTIKVTDEEKILKEINKKSSKKEVSQAEFDQAFALIRTNKFNEAEEAFKKLIQKELNEDITARSYYWLGEIYIAKKNYEQAAVNFLQAYKKIPTGSKAPDSLLKLGISLGNLKKNSEACNIFAKLAKEFPNASEKINTKLAAENKKLSCKIESSN